MENSGLIELGIFLISSAIMFGMMKAGLKELERETEKLSSQMTIMWDKFHSLRDTYVDREHFKEIIDGMRQDHRELKQDVKTVLGLASEIKAKMDKRDE